MIQDAASTAGMDEAYQAGEPAPKAKAEGEEEAPETKTVDEEAAETQTALLPKSVLGGMAFKEGEEITLKMVKDHGEEIEVSRVEKPDGSGSGEGEESAADEIDKLNVD